jgi:hypothetical protein
VFVAPDESQLAAAREVTRRAMAWASIVKDAQLRKEMTQGQADDAAEKTKTNTEGARKAVRGAWSHIFYPVRSDTAGKPFDLEHSLISAREPDGALEKPSQREEALLRCTRHLPAEPLHHIAAVGGEFGQPVGGSLVADLPQFLQ